MIKAFFDTQFFPILYFLFSIYTLFCVHELGHFLVARYFGVKVEVFSLGFGKSLFQYEDSKGTLWKIAIIPLGGYIKMFGDDENIDKNTEIKQLTAEERSGAFLYKNTYQKALIVIAGPLANYLFAVIVLFGVLFIDGTYMVTPKITNVIKDSLADQYGLLPGDTIMSINDNKINHYDEVQQVLRYHLRSIDTIKLEILRNNAPVPQIINFTIDNKQREHKRLGIGFGDMIKIKLGVSKSLINAIVYSYDLSASILKGIAGIIKGTESSKNIGGLIKITQISAATYQNGLRSMLTLIIALSINLGLLNLLPIPMLDGWHVLKYSFEALLQKKIPAKLHQLTLMIGFTVLISLTIFATWNDIVSIISNNK